MDRTPVIYHNLLLPTNPNKRRVFVFVAALSPHERSTLPRQVEVEDWNKVRQGGHPSIDLAQVAPGNLGKLRA